MFSVYGEAEGVTRPKEARRESFCCLLNIAHLASFFHHHRRSVIS